jgi:hypothetical protein
VCLELFAVCSLTESCNGCPGLAFTTVLVITLVAAFTQLGPVDPPTVCRSRREGRNRKHLHMTGLLAEWDWLPG